MNTVLGTRIKKLREESGYTQEQIAEKLNCSRQKYARLEKGLVDISYTSITAIAEILKINCDEITSVISDKQIAKPMFRKNGDFAKGEEFLFIENMLDVFYTHQKLYNSVRQDNY